LKKTFWLSTVTAALLAVGFATKADGDHLLWTRTAAPAETYITGGGWTLEQAGAANGLKSSGYCDSNGNQNIFRDISTTAPMISMKLSPRLSLTMLV
jgi:hypothetical protein